MDVRTLPALVTDKVRLMGQLCDGRWSHSKFFFHLAGQGLFRTLVDIDVPGGQSVLIRIYSALDDKEARSSRISAPTEKCLGDPSSRNSILMPVV